MLYSCPLCVCENMRCVRGTVFSDRRRGSVRTSLRGVSLIPIIICAGERVSCGTAPACDELRFGNANDGRGSTHLLQLTHGEDSPLTGLYNDIDPFLRHQLVDCFRCERTAAFPYPFRVLSADADGEAVGDRPRVCVKASWSSVQTERSSSKDGHDT